MNRTITVPHLSEPTRLDKFLVAELGKGWSRSALQAAIMQGKVKISGKQVPAHHFLKAGEIISLELDAAPLHSLVARANTSVTVTVSHEADSFLVVDKQAGLTVHPAPGVRGPTLVDGLLARYPELANVGDDPLRPGLVHRLDREVSGLMVVARTPEMFNCLKTQFASRTVGKLYIALVIGRISAPQGTIDFPLARSKRRKRKIAARPVAALDTRDAITHYTVRKLFQQVSLLEVQIETGRTHQIRAHLAALGYPIVGDTQYRPANLKFKASPGRLFLHAAELNFSDLTGQTQRFVSPLPIELQNFLAQLS